MSESAPLLDFPCDYTFKAFCAVDAANGFSEQVLRAVSSIIPCGADALRERHSSGGRYRCVSVLVRLHSREQLEMVYGRLRQIDGLVYLL